MCDDTRECGIELYPAQVKRSGSIFIVILMEIIAIIATFSFIHTEYFWVSIISVILIAVIPAVFWMALLKSPEYDLRITIDVQGITMTQRKRLLAQIPWDSVRDIQVCIEGMQAAATKFTNAGCSTVVISSMPINSSLWYDKTKSINWTHSIPETWNAPWSLYCGVGFKGSCYDLKEQIEAYRKEALELQDRNDEIM